jgi:hypothetical protein
MLMRMKASVQIKATTFPTNQVEEVSTKTLI